MKSEIKNRYENDFLVLLNEEYGYRLWFWFPNITSNELDTWWSELDSVDLNLKVNLKKNSLSFATIRYTSKY